MTSSFDSNVAMLRELQNDYADRRIMYAGRYDPATGAPDPNVYNGLDQGFVWARDRDGRVAVPALMSVLTALCSVQFGDRLRTGINEEGDREAIAPYIVRQNVNKLNQVLYESKKSNLTPIEGLEGGVVRAPSTAGLAVYVGPNTALGWAGGDIAIDAGDVPTNPDEFCWIVVYFTGVYGATPSYTTTTPVTSPTPDAFALTVAAAYAKALPNGAYRKWGVTLTEGQTAINYTTSRFVHLRSTFNPDWLVTVVTTGGSDGDVPTYDASTDSFTLAAQTGGGGSGAVELIATTTVTGSAAADITFATIPGTYKHLRAIFDVRATGANSFEELQLQINSDTGSNYVAVVWDNTGGATSTTTNIPISYIAGGSATAGDSGSGETVLPNYGGGFWKTVASRSYAGNLQRSSVDAGKWKNTAAITDLKFFLSANDLEVGSTISLYGIAG